MFSRYIWSHVLPWFFNIMEDDVKSKVNPLVSLLNDKSKSKYMSSYPLAVKVSEMKF